MTRIDSPAGSNPVFDTGASPSRVALTPAERFAKTSAGRSSIELEALRAVNALNKRNPQNPCFLQPLHDPRGLSAFNVERAGETGFSVRIRGDRIIAASHFEGGPSRSARVTQLTPEGIGEAARDAIAFVIAEEFDGP